MRAEQFQWSPGAGWGSKPPDMSPLAPQVLLVFGDIGSAGSRECLERLGGMYPHALRFGCSSAGEIQGATLRDGTLAATAIVFDHTTASVGRASIEATEGETSGAFEAGAGAVAALPARDLRHVFVLAPGNLLHGGELLSGVNSALPAGATLSGGFAGASGNVQGSWVWCGGEPEQSAVVALGLYGARLRVGRGSGGGWRPFGPERLITKSVKESIYEFDRQPALELYKQYLGEHAAGLPFSALRFPVGLRVRGCEPWSVRVITAIDEENGSLRLDRDIPPGARARFMVGSAEHLIEGAAMAVRESRRELDTPAQLSVVVSCYGRRVVLGEQTEAELETVRDATDSGSVLTGFYSYGEISRRGDGPQAELYNQAMTVTALAEA